MVESSLLVTARETINTEINGARILVDRLNNDFVCACQKILTCSGKVVVSGIGKSGHIGKKIAATLASTGTPSFYVHPAEALHGDLGMISMGDVVILISYSGFASEFVRIIPQLKALSVTLIAFTGNPASPLALASHHIINIHTEREACPLGLAPTSSAVNTLIMGDALAIAVMHERNFSEQDYARTHPAGSLGMRLLCRVADIMRVGAKTPLVTIHMTVSEALFELTRTGLGLVAIIDPSNEQLIGVFTDGDLRRWLQQGGNINANIQTAMTRHGHRLLPDMMAADALALFHDKRISAAPVINQHCNVVGAISLHDIHDAGIA